MKDFNSIIEKWVRCNTLPFNTELPLNSIRIYTQNNKAIEDFNCLTHCKFIEYNNEYRIIIPEHGDSHYFTVPEFDGRNIKYETCFDKLILELFGSVYVAGENILDDTIKVNIQDVKDALKYFRINYNFDIDPDEEDYRIEDGYYLYEGNDWDDDAMHYFKNSDLYENMKSFLISYFKYDFAPYTKYNTDFNPFSVNTKKLTLNKKFEKMTNNQIAKVLVDFLDTNGIFVNKSDATVFCMTLVDKINDKKLLKNLLLSLVSGKYYKKLEDKERSLCERIEYILNI